MKAILISIQSQHACNILNGIKLWEIRKKFPKDYVGWVYIYVTKGKPYITGIYNHENKIVYGDIENTRHNINGKVVARFWCDKVEEYVNGSKRLGESDVPMWGACNDYEHILKDTCLTEDELYDYCEDLSFKAIHITKLEIFNKPKDISEFYNKRERMFVNGKMLYDHKFYLTRAPQSWCWIEV